MVFTHTLFRRRLVSKEVNEAAKALVKTYGGSGRPEKVGKIFAPIHHNYSYGIKKTTLVARLIHQVKVKKIPLQKVFDATPWHSQKRRGRGFLVEGSPKRSGRSDMPSW